MQGALERTVLATAMRQLSGTDPDQYFLVAYKEHLLVGTGEECKTGRMSTLI